MTWRKKRKKISRIRHLRMGIVSQRNSWLGAREAQSVSDKLQPAITQLTLHFPDCAAQVSSMLTAPAKAAAPSEKEIREACLKEVRKAGLAGIPHERHVCIADAMCKAVLAGKIQCQPVLNQRLGTAIGKAKREKAMPKLKPATARVAKKYWH